MEDTPIEGEANAATAGVGAASEATEDEEESNDDDYSTLDDKPSPALCRAIDNFYKEFQKHHMINFANQLKDKYAGEDKATINHIYEKVLKVMSMMTTSF